MVSAWLRAAVRLQQPGLGTACIANGSAGRFPGLPAADHGGAGHAHQPRVAGSPGLATFHSAGVAQRGAVVGGHGRTGGFFSLTRDYQLSTGWRKTTWLQSALKASSVCTTGT